ncbi:MAG: hypothetical protein ABI220_01505 [Candidatus Saccharimonadales bacterium]
MSQDILVGLAVAILLILVFGASWLTKRRPHKLNVVYYREKWDTLQKLCRDKSTWPLAIIDADKLLDEVLKSLKFKGKTMGERLMAAQHQIKDNDGAWFGHKLRNRLVHESNVKLKERDVKDALFGLRSAIKDLGAL